MPLRKGMCYGNDVFPHPYDPSHANNSLVFFGSDNTAAHMAPLWGKQYTSHTGASCESGGPSAPSWCRYDLEGMHEMGVEVVRLYDWEPRNDHVPFLNECQRLGIGVIASVSNYFLNPAPDGGFNDREKHIPNLIGSFSTDSPGAREYHPAIVGIIFGNELAGYGLDQLVVFTNDWITKESAMNMSSSRPRIGHPFAFIPTGDSKLPCWGYWQSMLPRLASHKERLFLAPQTYNDATYLFITAENGKGWVEQTYAEFGLPIWFTEIGQSRKKQNAAGIVAEQLSHCLLYSNQHPDQLIGACFFSFGDKVWTQGTEEGSFGAHTHKGAGSCTITYTTEDFRIWDRAELGTLNVDVLEKTELYQVVKDAYTQN